MSISDKLNDCETCDEIKNNEAEGSSYSSDCEDFTSCSESLGKETDSDSLRLEFEDGGGKKGGRKLVIRQNKTFSTDKIREIERGNAMLVDRILYHNRRPNQYKTTASASFRKATSSEINRRRHLEKISRENEILLKKIQSVKPAVR